MAMFWKLTSPDYSDYHHTFINGEVEHPYGLPGIQCHSCGHTWIAPSRVLPIDCPLSLRSQLKRRPASVAEYRDICDAICAACKCSASDLKPGNSLLPSDMQIPSRPRADFLWGSLGSWVISLRIKDLFERAGFSGFVLFPITISKVGRREAKLAPPIPASGEPEDIMRSAIHVPGADVGPYFELLVRSDSRRVRGTEPSFVCGVCGFEQWSPPRQWSMEDSLWTGTDLFCLAPTSMLIVTDRVKERLVEIGASNVRAVPVG